MSRNEKPKGRAGTTQAGQRLAKTPARRSGEGRPRAEPAHPEDSAEAHAKLAKICGLQAVTGLFRAAPERVMRLYYQESLKQVVGPFCAQLAKLHRPYRLVSGEELTKVAGTVLHGGIVAAATPRTPRPLDLTATQGWAQRGEPMVILDGVGNPHNLGAIARTLAFFGLRRLVLSDHPAQAGLSDAAHRVAEGGLEAIEIYQANHLPKLLKRIGKFYRVLGTSLTPDAVPLDRLEPDPRPLALVLGNEETGLTRETQNACETRVVIPGSGALQSLNVSASAAILIYELVRSQASAERG